MIYYLFIYDILFIGLNILSNNKANIIMPLRTRSHQLEKESWSALDSIIPSCWVLRKPSQDYGIDGEIEIFDESGHPIGLMCFIQLKGTDENDEKKSLKHRFKLETINYYKSLELPVLIIKYLSKSKQLFYKWVYEIDSYYTRDDSKTIGIVFSENNLLKQGELFFIVEQLKIFRNLKGPRLNLPIRFHIKYESDSICDIPKGLISSSILKQAGLLSEIILFDFETTNLLKPEIIIDEKLISVNIACLTSFNLHLACKHFETRDSQKIGHDIIVLIALTLSQLGHNNIASELLYNHILESIFLEREEYSTDPILFSILSCFLKARRFNLAIDLANKIMEFHSDPLTISFLLIPSLFTENFEISDFEKIKNLFMKSINLSIESGQLFQAGTMHYNLAELYKRCPSIDYKKSLHHYKIALKLDPTYRVRSYFWEGLAGTLFNLQRYKSSEKIYKKAYSIEKNNELIALRADALMYSGKYKISLEMFDKYEKSSKDLETEWLLKKWLLKNLLHIGYNKKQIRKNQESINLIENEGSGGKKINIDKVNRAIELDLLCGLAWYKKGFYETLNGNEVDAFYSFLSSAILTPDIIDSWTNVILLGMVTKRELILYLDAFVVAYKKHGDFFVMELLKKINKQEWMTKPEKTEIINLLQDISNHDSIKDNKIQTVRMIGRNPEDPNQILFPNMTIPSNIEEIIK